MTICTHPHNLPGNDECAVWWLRGTPAWAAAHPQRECTPAEAQQWTAQHGDGYRTGAGDARADRVPRIQLVPIPADVPGETGSRYVARHVARAWAIGYTSGYMYTAGRPRYPDCDWAGRCAERLTEVCPQCGGHCMHGPACDHIARTPAERVSQPDALIGEVNAGFTVIAAMPTRAPGEFVVVAHDPTRTEQRAYVTWRAWPARNSATGGTLYGHGKPDLDRAAAMRDMASRAGTL